MYLYLEMPTLRQDGTKTGGGIVYPYDLKDLVSDLARYGQSLPPDHTEADLNSRGVYSVSYADAPEYDKFSQNLVSSTTPELIDGKWKLTYTVENKSQEEAEASVRSHRNFLIAETDWWAGSDHTMTQAQSDYRNALRNVPQQDGFPYSVIWPTKP